MTMARGDNFDELVDVLNATGWLVSDAFQPRAGLWTIALRKEGDYSRAYGNGATPSEALQRAMENRRAKPIDERKDKRPMISAPDYYEAGTRGRLQPKATKRRRVPLD